MYNFKYVDITSSLDYNEHSNNNVVIANLNPFRYRGYYYDIETGLYYLNSRYYDPQIGRFINADDVSNLDAETINGLNLYSYCLNNPIGDIDVDGNWSWKQFWKTALTVVAVVAVVAISVATAGIGTAITGALGGGLAASIIGGAIGGAISGAIMSGGISLVTQGINNGFSNINWQSVGVSALIGGVSGAIMGGIGGAVKYFGSTTKLYRAVSANEHNGILNSGKFSSGGFSEGKYFATSKANALTWGNQMYGNAQFKLVATRVSKSGLNQALASNTAYYWSSLDSIGKAYYIDTNVLNKILIKIWTIF